MPSNLSTPEPSRVYVLIFFFCIGILWFAGLGERHLNRPDEGRYAEIAREMAQSNDFVTPRLNNLKYFEKPPLQYWLTAIAFKTLGINEFSARLWTALSSFLCLLCVYAGVQRLANRATGLAAAAVLASFLWYFAMGHTNTLDMGLSVFLTGSLLCFLLSQRIRLSPKEEQSWLVGAWACAGFAFLSKGLIGLLIPAASLFIYSLLTVDFGLLKRMPWFKGIGIFLLITIPWMILAHRNNPEFFQFFIVHEHFTRFINPSHKREGTWYYFIPILMAASLPWTLFIAPLLLNKHRQHIRYTFGSRIKVDIFLIVWCLFILLFFSISKSKLPSYILPILPALAVLLAPILLAINRRGWIICLVSFACLALFFLSYPLIYPKLASEFYHAETIKPLSPWIVAAGAVLFGAWFASHFFKSRAIAVSMLSVFFVLTIQLVLQAYNSLHPLFSGYQVVSKLKQTEGESLQTAPIFSVGLYDQTLTFYLARPVTLVNYVDEFKLGLTAEPQKGITELNTFYDTWQKLPQAYAIMDNGRYQQFKTLGLPHRLLLTDVRFHVVSRQ